jgi:multimeric flavodoxin WrbA
LRTFTEFLSEATQNNKNAKIKIVAIQGSPRTIKSCSGGDSKTAFLMKKSMQALLSDVKVDVIDLSVMDDQPQVRPCKGCIGTANGFQCHYPCSCYSKDDGTNDLMYEEDVYKKMQEADGFIVFTPVHWNGPSSQVKALFDRLVCVNLTLTVDDAKEIVGDAIKDPKKNIAAEQSGKYRDLLKNHYEGKVGAFFIHGDDGANDYVDRKIPLSLVDAKDNCYITPKDGIMPIVNQCRYSGIFVPESCIKGVVFGYKKPYSQNNKDIKSADEIIDDAIQVTENLIKEIKKRKKDR